MLLRYPQSLRSYVGSYCFRVASEMNSPRSVSVGAGGSASKPVTVALILLSRVKVCPIGLASPKYFFAQDWVKTTRFGSRRAVLESPCNHL